MIVSIIAAFFLSVALIWIAGYEWRQARYTVDVTRSAARVAVAPAVVSGWVTMLAVVVWELTHASEWSNGEIPAASQPWWWSCTGKYCQKPEFGDYFFKLWLVAILAGAVIGACVGWVASARERARQRTDLNDYGKEIAALGTTLGEVSGDKTRLRADLSRVMADLERLSRTQQDGVQAGLQILVMDAYRNSPPGKGLTRLLAGLLAQDGIRSQILAGTSIAVLDLEPRYGNRLKDADLVTLDRVVGATNEDLLAITNFGVKGMETVDAALRELGIPRGTEM